VAAAPPLGSREGVVGQRDNLHEKNRRGGGTRPPHRTPNCTVRSHIDVRREAPSHKTSRLDSYVLHLELVTVR